MAKTIVRELGREGTVASSESSAGLCPQPQSMAWQVFFRTDPLAATESVSWDRSVAGAGARSRRRTIASKDSPPIATTTSLSDRAKVRCRYSNPTTRRSAVVGRPRCEGKKPLHACSNTDQSMCCASLWIVQTRLSKCND